MPLYICSLIATDPQPIPPNGYRLLRFPFGASESYDLWGMHQARQPDDSTITGWADDDRSGLIWPAVPGWASLTAVIQWEAGDYTELRDGFVRDPLGYTADPVNTTGTEHRPPSPGMQCWTKHHELFVDPAVPVAVRVSHNASTPRKVTHAQFKVAIHTDVATPN